MIAGAALALNYLSDPYRKLEEFPVSKYFDGFQSLAGLKFRSSLRVEADLQSSNLGSLVYIPEGKSECARRVVDLALIDGPLSDISLTAKVNFRSHRKKSAVRRLERRFKRMAEISIPRFAPEAETSCRPHDVRRSLAFYAIFSAVQNHYLDGNLLEYLATIGRCFGHQSLLTLLHTYAASMLLQLADFNLSRPANFLLVSKLEIETALEQLRDLYDGNAHARLLLAAAVKRIARESKIKSETSVMVVHCTEEERPTEQVRLHSVCHVPPLHDVLHDRPDLQEYWKAVFTIKRLALKRGIPFIIVVSKRTQQRYSKEFAAILDSCI